MNGTSSRSTSSTSSCSRLDRAQLGQAVGCHPHSNVVADVDAEHDEATARQENVDKRLEERVEFGELVDC